MEPSEWRSAGSAQKRIREACELEPVHPEVPGGGEGVLGMRDDFPHIRTGLIIGAVIVAIWLLCL
jgi:hypothetical protein